MHPYIRIYPPFPLLYPKTGLIQPLPIPHGRNPSAHPGGFGIHLVPTLPPWRCRGPSRTNHQNFQCQCIHNT